VPHLGARAIAVQDLLDEQRDRRRRIERAIAPRVAEVVAHRLDRVASADERQWVVTLDARQRGGDTLSHPWPPVVSVVSKHHCGRRPRLAQI